MSKQIPKPFLKWVGGKTQIIERILSEFPKEIENYHEPFLGGGSVLIGLLTYVRHGLINVSGKIYAYDVNEPLIYVYKNIQTNCEDVYVELQRLIRQYNSCEGGPMVKAPKSLEQALWAKDNYYYWIRLSYNAMSAVEKRSALGSAMFIFLNKTCFRGVFRVGPNGFNVPFGHYANPEIVNKAHLEEIRDLIQSVEFECRDFRDSLGAVGEGDFVYLDPPYASVKETSFVGYTENGFSTDSHKTLFGLVDGLVDSGVLVMMSNADVPMVRQAFDEKKYNINSILCKRAIHSKNPGSNAREVIIKNF